MKESRLTVNAEGFDFDGEYLLCVGKIGKMIIMMD